MRAGPMFQPMKREEAVMVPKALGAFRISANAIQTTPPNLSHIAGLALMPWRRCFIG
jgi:hypothetical protein